VAGGVHDEAHTGAGDKYGRDDTDGRLAYRLLATVGDGLGHSGLPRILVIAR
jgi:hypothetical protein